MATDETPVHQITVLPEGTRFAAPADQPILKSALQRGVKLPSSCRNGTCRNCLCRLVIGQIEYEIEWPGVSVEERRDGLILPCVARPRTDLVLRRGD